MNYPTGYTAGPTADYPLGGITGPRMGVILGNRVLWYPLDRGCLIKGPAPPGHRVFAYVTGPGLEPRTHPFDPRCLRGAPAPFSAVAFADHAALVDSVTQRRASAPHAQPARVAPGQRLAQNSAPLVSGDIDTAHMRHVRGPEGPAAPQAASQYYLRLGRGGLSAGR